MAEHEEEPLVAELGHKIDTILGEIQDKKEAYSHKDHLYESSLTFFENVFTISYALPSIFNHFNCSLKTYFKYNFIEIVK